MRRTSHSLQPANLLGQLIALRRIRLPLVKTLASTISCLMLSSTGLAWSDSILLRDGATIAGQILSGATLHGDVVGVDNQMVVVRNSQGQVQRVAKSQIDHIRFNSRIDPTDVPMMLGAADGGDVNPWRPATDSDWASTSTLDSYSAYNRTLWQFPDNNGGAFNKDIFGVLATFKGASTGKLYAGLYNFDEKGTFWIRLPKNNSTPANQLRFTLHGKHHPRLQFEPFTVKAQFFNQSGSQIGESTQVQVGSNYGSTGQPAEWFHLLQGVSGVTSPQPVQWKLPKGTQSVEFQVLSTKDNRRHLVGYLGNLSVQ